MRINAIGGDTVTSDNSELGIEDFRDSGVTMCSFVCAAIAILVGTVLSFDGDYHVGTPLTISGAIWLFGSCCKVQEYAEARCKLCWYNHSHHRAEQRALLGDHPPV